MEDQEFAESKSASEQHTGGFGGGYSAPAPAPAAPAASADGFMNIPDGIDEAVQLREDRAESVRIFDRRKYSWLSIKLRNRILP